MTAQEQEVQVSSTNYFAHCRCLFVSVLLAGILAGTITSTVSAGQIVLAGDITPTFRLTDLHPDLVAPGPQQFFQNVLGDGQQVVILETSENEFTAPEIDTFYNGLAGVTATTISGAVTDGQLTNADLLVLPAPDDMFSADEVSAIYTFLIGSGDLFVMGDGVFTTSSNLYVNSLLAGLGSGMNLNPDSLDPGNPQATGGNIVAHPLTTGVAAFNYGATSTVNGGSPLFLASTGAPFVAVEEFVPEPTSASLTLVAFGLLAYGRQRRERA